MDQKLANIEQMQAELLDMKLKYQKIEPLANCAHEMLQAGVLSKEDNGTYTLVEGYEQRVKEKSSQEQQQKVQEQVQIQHESKLRPPRRKAAQSALDINPNLKP